jgi:dolichol kinase
MATPIVTTEVQRKIFHSLMILVALVNWIGIQFFGLMYGSLLSVGFTGISLVFFIGFDFTRVRVYGYFPFRRITDRVMRPRERTKLGASVYFAVGSLLTFVTLYLFSHILFNWFDFTAIWMLSGWLSVTAVMVAAIGDGAAAIIGMRFGRHRIKGNRTLEGTIGGLLFGFLAFLPLWYFIGVPLIYGIIAATVLLIVDLVASQIDDNLLNPIVIGITLAIFEIILVIIFFTGVG